MERAEKAGLGAAKEERVTRIPFVAPFLEIRLLLVANALKAHADRLEAEAVLQYRKSPCFKSSQVATPRISLKQNPQKNNSTALFEGGCWVSLTGRFHRHSAVGWAECTIAGPGLVRRHAAQFSERSSAPLIGHARMALSAVLTRFPSTQTDDTQRGGKGNGLLPAP